MNDGDLNPVPSVGAKILFFQIGACGVVGVLIVWQKPLTKSGKRMQRKHGTGE